MKKIVLLLIMVFLFAGCATQLVGQCEPGEKNNVEINGHTFDTCLKAARGYSMPDGTWVYFDNRTDPVVETNALQRAFHTIAGPAIGAGAVVVGSGL